MTQSLRNNATAIALVETLFPAGQKLPAANPDQLLQEVNRYADAHPAIQQSIKTGLLWLEGRFLLERGKLFRNADRDQRETFLRKYSGSLVTGNLLRGITAPFKTAYSFQDSVMAAVGVSNGVKVPTQVEKFRWQSQIADVDALSEDQALEADVVVIGTGAGGAAAAYEFASKGLAVVLIEEGKYYDRRDFNGKLMDVIPKLYRNMGATTALGNAVIPIPIGKNVGGTTTINSGTCMRTPPAVLQEWQQEGLTELTEQELEPYFNSVEEILNVERAEPRYVGEIGKAVKTGAQALGFKQTHELRRNAKGCDGQGLCQFGCPTDAKQSTNVSFVPQALQRGAFLYTGFRANRLLWADDESRAAEKKLGFGFSASATKRKISGVACKGRREDGSEVRLTVSAERVVVAMGTFLTPLFLQDNGVRNKQLGRNLSIHPAGGIVGVYKDRDFNNTRTIPQGYGVADLAEQGIMFEGGTPPFAAHSVLSPLVGREYVEFTERFQNCGYFGFMIKDSSRGRVRRSPVKDLPLITYNMNEMDWAKFQLGLETTAQMHLRAGAEAVHLGGFGKVPLIKSEKELQQVMGSSIRPRDFLISAYHPLGTARLAVEPQDGVCDINHQVFGTEGLYVMDGSNVPSSLGANPQVTIMSLASRAARQLAEQIDYNYQQAS